MTVRGAWDAGRRDALVALAERLAAEIDGCPNARDRLPLVRVFLACVGHLETLDAGVARRARQTPPTDPYGPAGRPATAVDELLTRRKARRARPAG